MHPLFLVPNTSTTAAATDSAKTDEQCYPLSQPPPSSSPSASSQRKLPSSQYKGVVPQPNGRWGAQIYEKHRRVWLGTFNSEAEAARAYDVAAQRFRGREATTNFAALPPHSPELLFLLSLTKADLIDMLRKHTYLDELHHRLRSRRNNDGSSSSSVLTAFTTRDLLFEKVVTPSDVGKLNRLVIPKQHAERHFPAPMEVGGDGSGILLSLEDGRGKVWRFRYSYWNSSQSYVLTRGWNRYVKEMGLRPGDVVMFHRAIGGDGQLYIDWREGDGNGGGVGYDRGLDSMPSSSGSRGVRLFGVNIGYDGV